MQAHADFAAAVTPVTTTTGYTLLAVLGTGLVAILGDWAAFQWRSALYGRGPRLRLLRGLLHPRRRGRAGNGPSPWRWRPSSSSWWSIGPRSDRADQAWFGNQRAGAARWAVRAGCVAGAASLLTAIVITPRGGRNRGARHLRLAGRIRRGRLQPPPGTQPDRGPAHPPAARERYPGLQSAEPGPVVLAAHLPRHLYRPGLGVDQLLPEFRGSAARRPGGPTQHPDWSRSSSRCRGWIRSGCPTPSPRCRSRVCAMSATTRSRAA